MPDDKIFFAVAKVLFFGVLDSFDAATTGVVVFFSLLSCITSDLRGKWNLYETRGSRGGIVLLAPDFGNRNRIRQEFAGRFSTRLMLPRHGDDRKKVTV